MKKNCSRDGSSRPHTLVPKGGRENHPFEPLGTLSACVEPHHVKPLACSAIERGRGGSLQGKRKVPVRRARERSFAQGWLSTCAKSARAQDDKTKTPTSGKTGQKWGTLPRRSRFRDTLSPYRTPNVETRATFRMVHPAARNDKSKSHFWQNRPQMGHPAKKQILRLAVATLRLPLLRSG